MHLHSKTFKGGEFIDFFPKSKMTTAKVLRQMSLDYRRMLRASLKNRYLLYIINCTLGVIIYPFLTIMYNIFQTEKLQHELAEMDENGIDQFVRNKFRNLNEMLLARSKDMEDYVISQKPKKPEKNPNETKEEYEKRYEGKVSRVLITI
jgi:hypothetical protein